MFVDVSWKLYFLVAIAHLRSPFDKENFNFRNEKQFSEPQSNLAK